MKTIKLYVFGLLFVTGIFVACEDNAKDEEWGISHLYMPQSVLGDGGQTANLSINVYQSQSADTSIVVSLYRSGLASLDPVLADLIIATDTLSAAKVHADEDQLGFEIFKDSKLLPEDYYELSKTIALAGGQRENHVFLKLNKTKLYADPYTGKYVLPVKLSNPTKYELNEDRALTFFFFSKK